jgi:hypothetical protein
VKRHLAATLTTVCCAAFAQAVWPPLPKDGFISGRAATREDITAGRAAFVAKVNGVAVGKPATKFIPQYAWMLQGDKKIPVIVIQAEIAEGQAIIGARLPNGTHAVATLQEFELLGRTPPTSKK